MKEQLSIGPKIRFSYFSLEELENGQKGVKRYSLMIQGQIGKSVSLTQGKSDIFFTWPLFSQNSGTLTPLKL